MVPSSWSVARGSCLVARHGWIDNVLTRRQFLATPAGVLLAGAIARQDLDLRNIERTRVLRAADRYLRESPQTITATSSPRSAGGRHDYFSEGDYWWPDPANPDGPYIQRDGMTNPDNIVAQILDADGSPSPLATDRMRASLWTFETPDGRGIGKALAFMYPFIKDKSRWAHKPDVMYFDEWPVRHAALLFGGRALGRPEYVDLWKTLNADPAVDETIRNYFIRQPVLWTN